VSEAATLVFATGSARWEGRTRCSARAAHPEEAGRVQSFLERELRAKPLAPAWLWTSRRDLASDDFVLVEEAGTVRGVAACWDQRAFKQVQILAYRAALDAARPALSLLARIVGAPALPPPGSTLPLGYVTAFACSGDDPRVACDLLVALRARARARGLGLLSLSLASDHPLRRPLARSLRALEYRSVIYAVVPRGASSATCAVDLSRPHLEAALL
jgi:hypothetical protein